MELQLQVLVDAKIQGILPDAISFETGLTRAQAADPELWAYEHHGQEFLEVDPGALTSFFEDLALGRATPQIFATPNLQGVDRLFAIALFLHRDLVTHPQMPGIVASVDLAHRYGVPMYAHIDTDLCRFLRVLGTLFARKTSKPEEGENLRLAIAWIYEYVTNGSVPGADKLPEPTIEQVGSNGLVFARSTQEDPYGSWVELFRQGFTRGALFMDLPNGRQNVLATRKSVYIPLNLSRAADLLNEVERAMGEPDMWAASELWLESPPKGTLIRTQDLTEVFLRV